MTETFQLSRRALTAFWFAATCCVILSVTDCVRGQGRHLDLKDGRGVTVFFILGFLDEYTGRHVVEGDDLVEGFYCNETEKVTVFLRQLERLAQEQGLKADIRQETIQGCLTRVRSAVLSEALNAMYRKREEPPIAQSWMADADGRHHRLGTLWIDDQVFRGVERDLKFAYVAGAYDRYGVADSMRFANSQHKVALLEALLSELGASNIRTEATQGFMPQTNTIYFQPSAELRTWLGRAW